MFHDQSGEAQDLKQQLAQMEARMKDTENQIQTTTKKYSQQVGLHFLRGSS